MSLRNVGDGRWYWKFIDQHGVFHYYNPNASGLDPLCRDPSVREVSRPGTYGKETVVTCIRCLGNKAHEEQRLVELQKVYSDALET